MHALQVDLRQHPGYVQVCEDVAYVPEFLPAADARRLLGTVTADIEWRGESIRMFGRAVPVPRLVAWAGDRGVRYRYSGVDHVAAGWPALLDRLRRRLAIAMQQPFNFVLMNRYRSGADYMGWHADDEPALGHGPVIASVSLGATRMFRLRRKDHSRSAAIALEHGALLVMYGASQRQWQHALVKTRQPVGERINLTYRWIVDGTP